MPFPKDKKSHRSYDQESGMNRTNRSGNSSRKARKPAPVESSSEDDSFTESEVENFVQAKYKDDSRRKKTEVTRSRTSRGAPQQPKQEAKEADATDVEHVDKPEATPGTTGFLFLVAAARAVIPVPVTHHATNEYIPSAGNMFFAIWEITNIIGSNTKLYEVVPDYSSIALNLYYGYVYYYQVLRARDDIGTLTLFERRSLRILESIGKPESWPVAAPLSGFVQAFGSAEVPDKKYTVVSPALPNLSKMTKDKGLLDMSKVNGIGRVPIVPAFQEFLRRFGEQSAPYDDATNLFHPAATPLNSTSDANAFVGLQASRATDADFQSLSFNTTWNSAFETEEPIGQYSLAQRQTAISRWRIPKVENVANLTTLEEFLFGDQSNVRWIKNLLRIANAVNELFPGSTNLGAIPPTTRMETFSSTKYSVTKARVAVQDSWYHAQNKWKLDLVSHYFGDAENIHNQAAATAAVNITYTADVMPALIATTQDPQRTGPYFESTGTDITVPLIEAETFTRQDPVEMFHELINNLYDNHGLSK